MKCKYCGSKNILMDCKNTNLCNVFCGNCNKVLIDLSDKLQPIDLNNVLKKYKKGEI